MAERFERTPDGPVERWRTFDDDEVADVLYELSDIRGFFELDLEEYYQQPEDRICLDKARKALAKIEARFYISEQMYELVDDREALQRLIVMPEMSPDQMREVAQAIDDIEELLDRGVYLPDAVMEERGDVVDIVDELKDILGIY